MMPGVGKERIAEMPPQPLSDRERIEMLEVMVKQLTDHVHNLIARVAELENRPVVKQAKI